MLEATAEPGGAVRSAEVAAPGYLSDLFSSFYPLAASPSPLCPAGPGRVRAALERTRPTC